MASSSFKVEDLHANSQESIRAEKLLADCKAKLLINAVLDGNVAQLKHALSQGADVNIVLDTGVSLLGRAVQLGNEDIIQILIDAKHYLPAQTLAEQQNSELLNIKHHSEWKRLTNQDKMSSSDELDFSNAEDFSITEECAEDFANCTDSHQNSSRRGLQLFRMLQSHAPPKYGCNVNFADYFDRMAIHYAAETGNLRVVKRLLEAGCLLHVSDNSDITPLHLAVRGQHVKMVEFLLGVGSRVNSKTREKRSALHLACSLGNFKIVKLLIENGAFLEALDASEQTPLLVAVKRGHFEVVRLLLMEGAKAGVEEIHGYTPLSEAVWNGDEQIARILISFGARISGHYHLLHFTIMRKSYPLCKLLVDAGGAYLDYHDDNGDTPLHVAVKYAEVNIVKLLLERGSNVLLGSQISGKTPVHFAVENLDESLIDKFCEIMNLLIYFGANIDCESYTPGETPLFQSILFEKFLFSEELIRHGCDPYLGNVFSCKTNNLDIAIKKKNLRVVKLLVYSGFAIEHSEEAERCSKDHSAEIYNFLKKTKECPLSLTKLSRIAVRHCMKNYINHKVNQLHLPALLKDFLLFKDKEFVS